MYVNYDRGKGVYACARGKGHLIRNEEHLDNYVTAVVLERLATVDFGDFAAEHPEAVEPRAEAAELRERLDDAAAEYSAGRLSASMLGKVEAELVPKIKAAEKRARAASVPPNIAELAGEGVDERWDAMTVEQQRDVIRVLLDVTVLPSTKPRGSRDLDPDATSANGTRPASRRSATWPNPSTRPSSGRPGSTNSKPSLPKPTAWALASPRCALRTRPVSCRPTRARSRGPRPP
jgi:hypothetical protein